MTGTDIAGSEATSAKSVRNLIRETALLLDREDLDGWLALFSENSVYELGAYSPEIRAKTIWWNADRAELVSQLGEIHQHVRDPARRLHLVTPMLVAVSDGEATATSHFAVYRTLPDGESSLFAVGRYEDELVLDSEVWRYTKHSALLETRILDAFTHLPL